MIEARSSKRCANTLATKLYEGLGFLLGNSMIQRRLGAEFFAYTYTQKYCKSETNGCWCWDWMEALMLLNIDLTIALIGVSLLSESDVPPETRLLEVHKFMVQTRRVPDETHSRFKHMMAFIDAKHGMCREALADLKDAQTLRQMAGLEPDAGLEQDIEKQVAHMKACKQVRGRCMFARTELSADLVQEAWLDRRGSDLHVHFQVCRQALRSQRFGVRRSQTCRNIRLSTRKPNLIKRRDTLLTYLFRFVARFRPPADRGEPQGYGA
jgi:hypothetical protein